MMMMGIGIAVAMAASPSRSTSGASPLAAASSASSSSSSHNSTTTTTTTSIITTETPPWKQMMVTAPSPALPLSSIVIASLSCIFLSCIFLLLALSYFIRRRLFVPPPSAAAADCEIAHHHKDEPQLPLPLKPAKNSNTPSPPIRRFTLKQIRAITSDFRVKLQVRPDGAAPLYKGSLDGAPVLVRKVDNDVPQLGGGMRCSRASFMASVSLASRVRHPNLAKLLGFCAEGNSKAMMAVYENVEGAEALGVLLSRPVDSGGLDWGARYGIAIQLAETLDFLHQAYLFHGEVRPENVLLLRQVDGIPKLLLAGFGHAAGPIMNHEGGIRTTPPAMATTTNCGGDESSSSSSRSAAATSSEDVYGFGRLLLLCLVMGKGETAAAGDASMSTTTTTEPSFLEWVFLQAKQGIYEDALDRRLLLEAESEEVRVCVELAFCCLQVEMEEEEEEGNAMARRRSTSTSSRLRRRPRMSEVCRALRHRQAMGLPLLASMAFGGGGRTTSDDSIDIDINSPPDLLLRSDQEDEEEQVVVVDVDHVSSSSARRRSTTSPADHYRINHDDLEPCYQVFSLRRFHGAGRSFS